VGNRHMPSTIYQGRRIFIGLLMICSITACTAKEIWYKPKSPDMVWYQQDTLDDKMSTDLEECASVSDDLFTIDHCMQSKGYLLIPRTEAELLKVRWLQEEGLTIDEIAEHFQWSREKVVVYTDVDYELPQSISLGRQPVEISSSIGKPAVKPLIASLDDNDPLVRRHAAEALGRIKDPEAVEPLIAVLNDSDPLIRRQAVEALGKIKDSRAAAPLISVLGNKDEISYMRASAADALGRIREASAVEFLISALNDQQWDVRSRAAKALGRIRDPRAVEALIVALRDEDATVRAYAVDALSEIGHARAVEPLYEALDDENKNVRQKVERALTKITGESFAER